MYTYGIFVYRDETVLGTERKELVLIWSAGKSRLLFPRDGAQNPCVNRLRFENRCKSGAGKGEKYSEVGSEE